ncbi:hypothetical protein B0H14DRAFT_2856777 [Mycena olivaceomarginata]|nr:hypothetical protein B0H14DRAFT_2856777 [Mycena olivaceomarginata]
MDSTPLFCGGASSGLGGCGRLTLPNRGPGSGAVASVVSMESRYFSRAQLAGLYNARLCQCQLEGVGCAVWCVSFVSCLFLKEKIIPSTPSGNALGAKHTLHVPQIACEHADQKQSTSLFAEPFLPNCGGLLLPESGICIGTGERLFRATSDPRYILFPPLPHIQRSSRRLGRDRLGYDQSVILRPVLMLHMTHSVDPGILRAIRGVSLPAVLWFINGNGRGSLAPDLYINI